MPRKLPKSTLSTFAVVILASSPLLAEIPAKTPNPHGEMQIPCTLCHQQDSWKVETASVKFDHDATALPLVGKHRAIACRDCHTTLKFSEVRQECASCHQDIHRGQFGVACQRCHSAETFLDLSEARRLHDLGRMPLLGTHRQLFCDKCHFNGKFVGMPTDCKVCHIRNYEATTAPRHREVGFDQSCERCHSPEVPWLTSHYDHVPSFPLAGGHRVASCQACHTTGIGPLSADCYQCHRVAYDGTANPRHGTVGFSHACKACHTINAWRPASFDHGSTGFSLTGQHRLIGCVNCHQDNNFNNLNKDCYGCHHRQYEQGIDPDHSAAGYSKNCNDCHTTDRGWIGKDYKHDRYFRIYSGEHKGKWKRCSDCHQNHNDYSQHTCRLCHDDEG